MKAREKKRVIPTVTLAVSLVIATLTLFVAGCQVIDRGPAFVAGNHDDNREPALVTDDHDNTSGPAPASGNDPSAKAITAFSFQGFEYRPGIIDDASGFISLWLPYGTPTERLVAIFATTGESVSIGNDRQVSGVTPNDFSADRTYRVLAGDKSYKDYLARVIKYRLSATQASVTTLAGQAPEYSLWCYYRFPSGIAVTGGYAYIADRGNNRIGRVDILTSAYEIWAGSASGDAGYHDGAANDARFSEPVGITTDGTNLYICERVNSTIRRIDIASKMVTTIAGKAGQYGIADGQGVDARFMSPAAMTILGDSLYVVDSGSHTIRKIVMADATVTTIAGAAMVPGNVGGKLASSRFRAPSGITTDGAYLYVSDTGNSIIRAIDVDHDLVTTLAGTGTPGKADGATGKVASFDAPHGLCVRGTTLYVADTNNHAIRAVELMTTEVTTVAGGVMGDADSRPGAAAQFHWPEGIAADGGMLYIADSANCAIRTLDPATGLVSTLFGSNRSGYADGTGSAARFMGPRSITLLDGDLYVMDGQNYTIRKVTVSGVVTTIAGLAGAPGDTANSRHDDVDGTGSVARLGEGSLMTDGKDLFLAERAAIRRITKSGIVTTLAGKAGETEIRDGIGGAARFDRPSSIACDGLNLYVTDQEGVYIRQIVIATGAVTTIAGRGGARESVDGVGNAARFADARSIAVDGVVLYVGDAVSIRKIDLASAEVSTVLASNGYASLSLVGNYLYAWPGPNGTLCKIDLSTNDIMLIAGNPQDITADIFYSSRDGVGINARFGGVRGLVSDGAHTYVADCGSDTIRVVTE
jgi:hypothetical protein